MKASIIQDAKGLKTKTTIGQVLQDGLGFITIVVTDSNGSQKIKRFDKFKCRVRYIE